MKCRAHEHRASRSVCLRSTLLLSLSLSLCLSPVRFAAVLKVAGFRLNPPPKQQTHSHASSADSCFRHHTTSPSHTHLTRSRARLLALSCHFDALSHSRAHSLSPSPSISSLPRVSSLSPKCFRSDHLLTPPQHFVLCFSSFYLSRHTFPSLPFRRLCSSPFPRVPLRVWWCCD